MGAFWGDGVQDLGSDRPLFFILFVRQRTSLCKRERERGEKISDELDHHGAIYYPWLIGIVFGLLGPPLQCTIIRPQKPGKENHPCVCGIVEYGQYSILTPVSQAKEGAALICYIFRARCPNTPTCDRNRATRFVPGQSTA